MPHQYGVTLTFGGTASSPNPFTIASLVYATPGYGLLSNGVFDQVYPHSPPYTLPAWTVVNHSTVYGVGASGIYLRNGGLVINDRYAAIIGGTGVNISRYTTADPAGTVVNTGAISGETGAGVVLATGGVTNDAGGIIYGHDAAVSIAQGGTVTNFGTLKGTVSGVALYSGGEVTNSGMVLATSASGVLLSHGGGVRNMPISAGSIALIEGYNAIKGTQTGTAGVIAIYNYGTLIGTPGNAIDLTNGGGVANFGTIIGGSIRSGIYATGAYSVVHNDGTIRGFLGVNIADGYVRNTGSGFIAGGVNLRGYGNVLNLRGTSAPLPVIQANTAIPSAVAVQLYGLLQNDAYVFGGVVDQWRTFGTDTAVPTVSNAGVITGLYDAVQLRSFLGRPYPSGVLSNIGTLTGFGTIAGANGVVFSHLTATVTNAGDILGTGTNASYGYGLQLSHGGGTIRNAGAPYAGLIYGHRTAVSVYYGSATTTNFGTIAGAVGFSSVGGTYDNTLINFGTIIGSFRYAVEFGDGDNLLIDEPGAVFTGNVSGLGGTNALELASGSSNGTLHGLGSTFKDFALVTIDAGANWYIDGSNYNALTHQPASVANSGIFNVTPGGRFTARGSIDTPITVHAGSALIVNPGATLASPGTEAAAVIAAAGGRVANYGLIDPPAVGVTLLAAGTVVNGSRFSAAATIAGYDAAVDLGGVGGTLVNYGSVHALGPLAAAVLVKTADVVLNGIAGSGTALITGALGITDNDGTIVNGSTAHTTGTIYGSAYAVAMTGTGAALTNFANVLAPAGTGLGVNLHAGILNNATGAAGAGYIRAATGIYAYAGTIANDGTVLGNGTAGVGIDFVGSGTIVNGSMAGAAATIGGMQHGIGIANGGTPGIFDAVTVQSNGLVSGANGNGIDINGAFATVINGYLVRGKADGISAKQSSLPTSVPTLNVTNAASGLIQGTIGIQADGRTNLLNAGTIIGTGGTAVSLGNADDMVTLAPSAGFVGTVDAGGGTNLLELAGGLVTGTLAGFGSTIVNFPTLLTDASATWDFAGNSAIGAGITLINQGAIQASAGDDLTILAAIAPQSGAPSVVQVFAGGTIGVYGSVASGQTLSFASSSGGEFQIGNPAAFAGTIAGFVVGGPTIDLPGITATGAGIVSNVLKVRAGGGYVAYLPVTGSFTNTKIQFGPDGASGTAITLACFAAGTRLLTSRGYRPVETLRKDDTLWAALQRRYLPALWIGRRNIDCRRHARPELVWPVRIARGAFGNRCPARNVLLSPDHAVFIDEVLIPVRLLINGTSIVQVPAASVTYYHVELPQHDIVLADGLAAESYLDAGARAAFDNGDAPLLLHPDFAARRWEAAGCAPLVVTGPRLAAARRRIAAHSSTGGGAIDPGVTEATSQSRNFAMFGVPAVCSGATT